MINHQDVAMLCAVYKLPKPLWNTRGGITGARRRDGIVYCPTSNSRIVLKVCDDMQPTVAGGQKALRIGPFPPLYVWCKKHDRKRRPVVFETVLR
jgi:hypothetical protein